MRRRYWLAAVLAVVGTGACGSNSTTAGGTDAGGGSDVITPDGSTDGGSVTPTDGGSGGPTDVAPGAVSNAGAHCHTDSDCGGTLTCDTSVPNGLCSAGCTEGATASEPAMCGGRGSTCLTYYDNTNAAQSYCRHACTPTARTTAAGACPPDMVCTGWWYTTMDGTPDSTGCEPFCTSDAQCDTSAPRCNVRTGECGMAGYNPGALADGEPCDPTVTAMVPGMMNPVNVQCRGICFSFSNTDTHAGICTSFVNLRQATVCPDDPTNILPAAANDGTNNTDNLGICNSKQCNTDSDCTRPLHCLSDPTGGASLCDYLSNLADGGMVVHASTPDGGGTDATVPDATVPDAARPDAPAADVARTDAGAPG